MRIAISIGLILVLLSCHRVVQTKAVNLSYVFDDNSSKVWLMNKLMIGDKNYSPMRNSYKDIVIFYKNGACVVQPLNTLGDSPGAKGVFEVDGTNMTLKINFSKSNWKFNITTLEEENIVLSPDKDSDIKYTVHLIPLPEL